jgi:hypothetical protein
MAKTPTAKEFLTDPKFGEQKGFLKDIITGIAEEMREERKVKPKKKDDSGGNLFDSIFGSDDEEGA